jgi:hypothetical protein
MLRLDLGGMIAGLDRMASGLAAASDGAPIRAMAQPMADRGKELVLEGFAGQQTPDGAAWAPRKQGGGWPILDKTGDMKGSSDCEPGPRVDGAGLDLTFAVRDEKSVFHQDGTRRGIPSRKMLFDEGGARPERWIAELDAMAQDELDAWLERHVKG